MARLDCKECGGTGWLVTESDGFSSADRCPCVAEVRSEALEGQARIPANYQQASTENFYIPSDRDNPIANRGFQNVMVAIRNFERNYPKNAKPGLLLVGAPGTGKTHLAVAVFRALLSRGHEGIFFDYQNLLDLIRSGYNQTMGTSDREAYRIALESEILLLDDLGAHRVTDWVEDTVTAIVTYRYNNKKTLIATTNLPDPDMGSTLLERSAAPAGHSFRTTLEDRIGQRARSRLFEMCHVICMPTVADYRVKPHKG